MTDEAKKSTKRIRPMDCKINLEGLVDKEVVVYLSPNISIQDVYDDPAIWAQLQTGSGALRTGDTVKIWSNDRKTRWLAYVTYGSPTGASLTKPEIQDFGKVQVLPGDENYRGEADGVRFILVRKKDNVTVATAATVSGLERELKNMYAVRAA